MAKPITKTPRGREQRHVNGYKLPAMASKMANLCSNTAATRILYLREQWDFSTIYTYSQIYAINTTGRSTEEFTKNG